MKIINDNGTVTLCQMIVKQYLERQAALKTIALKTKRKKKNYITVLKAKDQKFQVCLFHHFLC